MNTALVTALQERIQHLCYKHILPHLARYRAEPDIEQCLPLMEPQLFAAFATQACRDAATLVVKAKRKLSKRQSGKGVSFAVTVRGFQSEPDNEQATFDCLVQSLHGFANALEDYAAVIARFRQLLGQAYQSSWENGCTIGDWATRQFGLAGILIGMAGGYLSGMSIEREMQAECERLQQAFHVMLEAYDQGMNDLTYSALNAVCRYSS